VTTAREHLKAAFEALLRGDLTERDRQIKLCEEKIHTDAEHDVRLRFLSDDDNVTMQ
jgi:hypothetical protein